MVLVLLGCGRKHLKVLQVTAFFSEFHCLRKIQARGPRCNIVQISIDVLHQIRDCRTQWNINVHVVLFSVGVEEVYEKAAYNIF
jgi:hypothetical protein